MLDFLKRFGLGILYILLSPFLIAFLIGWAIYTLVIFFIELFHAFKSFFKGKKFFDEFEEDLEAKRILNLEQYSSTNIVENNESTEVKE